MGSVIIPCTVNFLRKVKSKRIVKDFLVKNVQRATVDVEETNREFTTVYTSLFQYVRNHPELGVTLVREEGDIVLYNDSLREDSSLHN
jgi:hypothetical protein